MIDTLLDIWERSVKITKMSFRMVFEDKELILFPNLAILTACFYVAILFLPVYYFDLLDYFDNLLFVSAFTIISYIGAAIIITFFEVCVVNTCRARFSGGNATFRESIVFASSRFWTIIKWGIVSGTVMSILKAIQSLTSRSLIGSLIAWMTKKAWALATAFVIPIIVYENIGSGKAISRSMEILRKTWGENLFRYFGLGFVQFLCNLLGFMFFMIVGLFLGMSDIMRLILLGVFILYFVIVNSLFAIASHAFNTALYIYATENKVPDGFDSEVLRDAFMKKEGNG
jgi:hypothetical protein